MPPHVNQVSKRFGRLLVISEYRDDSRRSSSGRWRVICRCDCGETHTTSQSSLLSGHTSSCGCIRLGLAKTHGESANGISTPEYSAWKAMKVRCLQATAINYHNYGGRGIKICKRWLNSYENFLADVGRKPVGDEYYTLDRIDNNGNYEPRNVKWSTRKEQCRNKRTNTKVRCDGQVRLIVEWSEISGVSEENISKRLRIGWSPRRAIFDPVQRRPEKEIA